MLSSKELNIYVAFALELSHDCAAKIQESFYGEKKVFWKEDGSPVTDIDRLVNQMTIDRIKAEYPTHGILGEEMSVISGHEDFLWIVDPIDGTLAFISGLPTFVYSLSLLYKREVVLAIIQDPLHYNYLWSIKGSGTKDGDNHFVKVSNNLSLRNSIIGTCICDVVTYDLSGLDDFLKEEGAKTVGTESIIFNSMLVASGGIAGLVFPGTNAHDSSSVKLIVEEARGKVTDLFGNNQYYDQPIKGFIASNGNIHAELLETVNQALKWSSISKK